MAATLLSASLTCVIALFLGQAALRLAGAREWSWLSPPIGISIAMLVAVPAIHLPGRCTTMATLLGGLTIASVIWIMRTPEQRPSIWDLLAVIPVALLTLIPFLALGRAGISGAPMDNDMAAHLLWAEAILSRSVEAISPLPLDYPLGPHAMVAVITKGLGIRVDQAFAGWVMALPILNAWTALALFRRSAWPGKVIAATVVGMPFLVAAYYGEGSFKEVVLAGQVLALTLLLAGCGPALGRGRWVPFSFLVGGILSVYSIAGLPWPLLIVGSWLVVVGARSATRRGLKGLTASIRRELPALAIALGVLIVCLVPQLPRLEHFAALREGVNGLGIEQSDLGNLAGPLSGREAFGVWNNPDFRFPASPTFSAGMWAAFVFALVLLGAVWALRRGRWMLPLAAGGSMLIWVVSTRSQSPYVAAKALVIASPLLLALAVFPLVERGVRRRSPLWMIAPLLALVLIFKVGISDVRALRISPLGPTEHMSELRSLRPTLAGRPTLFLGNDDFVLWELAGVPVSSPVLYGVQQQPIRPQKAWAPGEALDFDSVDAATLNMYKWVITTRDAAGSTPPPQFHLARVTDSYALWQRVGTVRERSLLPEGEMAGATLDCRTARGRAVTQGGGIAGVREPSIVIPVPPIAAGTAASVQIAPHPGIWELQAPYTSPLPVNVVAPGLQTTLPPNLDRQGPRWRIGRVVVHAHHPITVSFRVEGTAFTSPATSAWMGALVATPVARERILPVRQACNHYVDWYLPSAGKRRTHDGESQATVPDQ